MTRPQIRNDTRPQARQDDHPSISIQIAGSAEAFDGPLDLLLSLVRRHQYPLDRLPIAEITRQYCAYLQRPRNSLPTADPTPNPTPEANVELGAEFIETASWLILLKSRALLPPDPSADPASQERPEQELRRVLLDHATMKQTAARLAERMAESGLSSGLAASPSPPEPGPPPPLTKPTVQDALLAARRALQAAQARARAAAQAAIQTTPAPEPYPVEAQLRFLLEALSSLPPGQSASTEPWFAQFDDPLARVALLLALLELARLSRLSLAQPHRFGPIYLKPTDLPSL